MSTKIEWTDETWNPVTGCTPISVGCAHCYARRMAQRLRGRFGYPEDDPFAVTIHSDENLRIPHEWKKPRMIFICSMGDLMHEGVPDWVVLDIISTMSETPQHTYQVLTKRPERLLDFAWPSNCWVGVTVETDALIGRIDILRKVRAPLRFVSFEPLLSSVCGVDLTGIDWVIVGAETGPGHREMWPSWATYILDACARMDIPFFFKRDSSGSRMLDGRTWDEMPKGQKVMGL